MTDLMHREIEEVFYMVMGGMTTMMVIDALHVIWEKVKRYRRVYVFIYLGSWIVIANVFCTFLYQGSYGIISWYTLPVFAIGCILWKKGICGILNLCVNVQGQNGDKNYGKENKRACQSFRGTDKRRY